MSEATREMILTAGAKLFARQGFEQAKTADVAKEAGVSEPTLFRHFPTKESLLFGIFKLARQRTNDIARRLGGGPPADAVVNVFIGLSRFLLEEESDLGQVSLIEGRRASARARPLLRGSEGFNRLVEGIIQRGQREGVFRTDLNVEAVRQAIIGAGEAMMMGWLWQERSGGAFRAHYSEDEAIAVLRCCVDGMKVRTTTTADDMKKLRSLMDGMFAGTGEHR